MNPGIYTRQACEEWIAGRNRSNYEGWIAGRDGLKQVDHVARVSEGVLIFSLICLKI